MIKHCERLAAPQVPPRYNKTMLRDLAPLYSYMRRYRWGYLWGTLSCICTNTIWVMFPQVIRIAIDGIGGKWVIYPRVLKLAVDALSHGDARIKVLIFAVLLVVIALIKGVFLYSQRWILIGISRKIEFDLRNDLFRKLEEQDSGFYQRYRTGDIMARMTNDLNAVRNLLGPALMYSANTIFFTVGALFFLLRISPWLTLVAFAPMPLASILVQYFGSKIHDRFERIQASFSDISSQAQENYSGARLVRAFAREESQIGLFERLNRQYIARSLRLVQLMGMLWPTLEFVLGIAMILTLLVGGHQVIAHRISVGQFVAFNTYMVLLTWPIIAVGWVVNIFQRGTASVKRIDELLRAVPAIDDSAADPAIQADTVLDGEIEFRDLSFSYNQTPVLRGISLRIPAGSSLAIVGPTGSGKSTLINLITRLYEAPEGSLLIDGRRCATIPWRCCGIISAWFPRKHFFSALRSAKTWPLARPTRLPRNCSKLLKQPTFAWSLKSFPRALKPWWASAASRSPAGRSSAQPSPGRCCESRPSSSSTTRWPAWTPTPKNASWAACAIISRTRQPF